jgi:hypothetical protein
MTGILGLDGPGELEAVHQGHVQVGEDQMIGLLLEEVQGLPPVPGLAHLHPQRLQGPHKEEALEGLVVHQKDPHGLPPHGQGGPDGPRGLKAP